jgi:hypothetical protein
MSLDSKISILLSQLKNNPELLNRNTNSARLEDVTVPNEPLFAGITGNMPTLLGAASLINDPNLFNVKLDLFILLKEQLTSSLKLIDILSISQDKAFKEVLVGREEARKSVVRPLESIVEIDQFIKFLRTFNLTDSLTINESKTLKSTKSLVTSLKTLDGLSKKASIKRSELLDLLDEIIIKRTARVKPIETIRLADVIKVPKAKFEADKLTIRDFTPAFKTNIENHKDLVALNAVFKDIKQIKVLQEDVRTKSFTLNPKAFVLTNRLSAKSRVKLNFSFDVPNEQIKLFDITTKDTGVKKQSAFSARTNALVSKFLLSKDTAATKSKHQLKTITEKNDLVVASIDKFFKVNRLLFETYNIRDGIIKPAKFKQAVDNLASFSNTSKKFDKPINDIVDLIIKTSLNPNLAEKDQINILNSILTPRAKINTERLEISEFIKLGSPFRLLEVFDIIDINIARFLKKYIIRPEAVKALDNLIEAKSLISTTQVGVRSRDRDAGGIGDVFFSLGRKIVDLVYIIDKVKKEAKLPRKERLKIQDSSLEGRSKLILSRIFADDDKRGTLVGKALISFTVGIEDNRHAHFLRTTKSEKLKTRSFTVTPAFAEQITERFLVNDSFNPYLFHTVKEVRVELKDILLKKFQEKGIRDTLSSSEKGYVWMRDEEYMRGAYFLQPYVATIPPGRSRQF